MIAAGKSPPAPSIGVPQTTWRVAFGEAKLGADRYTVMAKAFELLGKYDETNDSELNRMTAEALGKTDLGRRLATGGEGELGGPEARELILNAAEGSYRSAKLDSADAARLWASTAKIASRRTVMYLTVADPRGPRLFLSSGF